MLGIASLGGLPLADQVPRVTGLRGRRGWMVFGQVRMAASFLDKLTRCVSPGPLCGRGRSSRCCIRRTWRTTSPRFSDPSLGEGEEHHARHDDGHARADSLRERDVEISRGWVEVGHDGSAATGWRSDADRGHGGGFARDGGPPRDGDARAGGDGEAGYGSHGCSSGYGGAIEISSKDSAKFRHLADLFRSQSGARGKERPHMR